MHIDSSGTYGGSYASFSISEFESWLNSIPVSCDDGGEVHAPDVMHLPQYGLQMYHDADTSSPSRMFDLGFVDDDARRVFDESSLRQWVIDIMPQYVHAVEEITSILVRAGIINYVNFILADGNGTVWSDGVLCEVPLSRNELFSNNRLSLVEKRLLMRVLQQCDDTNAQTGKCMCVVSN